MFLTVVILTALVIMLLLVILGMEIRHSRIKAYFIGCWVTDRPDLVPKKALDKYYWEITEECLELGKRK